MRARTTSPRIAPGDGACCARMPVTRYSWTRRDRGAATAVLPAKSEQAGEGCALPRELILDSEDRLRPRPAVRFQRFEPAARGEPATAYASPATRFVKRDAGRGYGGTWTGSRNDARLGGSGRRRASRGVEEGSSTGCGTESIPAEAACLRRLYPGGRPAGRRRRLDPPPAQTPEHQLDGDQRRPRERAWRLLAGEPIQAGARRLPSSSTRSNPARSFWC